MSKNGVLFGFLSNFDALSGVPAVDVEKRNNALNALIKADHTDERLFRLAVVEHKEFWESVLPGLTKKPAGMALGGFLNYTTDEEFQQSEDFLDPEDNTTLITLRNLAVEQRIKLGLKDAPDEVLIEILKDNPAECRAYLGDKHPQLKVLSEAHGWQPTPAVVPPQLAAGAQPDPAAVPENPKNASTEVLSNEKITEIQTLAKHTLFLKYLTKSDDQELLTHFLEAQTLPELIKAAKALGLPQSAHQFLELPVDPLVRDRVAAKLRSLKENIASGSFAEYVERLSPDQIKGFATVIKAIDVAGFKAQLPNPYNTDLTAEELNKALKLMSAAYLEVIIPSIPVKPTLLAELRTAINAVDDAALKTALKTLVGGNNNYVEILPERTAKVRASLVDALIRQLDASPNNKTLLTALDKVDLLNPFKTELAKLGVTRTDWVVDDHMGVIKQWARTKAFEIQLDEQSKFKAVGHPKLIENFKKLPVSLQRELLNSPVQLDILLRATAKNQIEHVLGRTNKGLDLDSIVSENQRLELFGKIHNSAVARVLALIEPPITLNADLVNQINNTFLNGAAAATINDGNFDNFSVAIARIPGLGAAADALETNKAEIIEQHHFNTALLNTYSAFATFEADKNILSVFLAAKKTVAPAHATVHELLPQTPAGQNALTDAQKKLNKALKSQLDPLLAARNNSRNKLQLQTGTVAEVNETLASIQTDISTLNKNRKSLTIASKHLNKLVDVEDFHFMNPAFHGRAKDESVAMLVHFKELGAQCDLILDGLRREKEQLLGISRHLEITDARRQNLIGTDQGMEALRTLRNIKNTTNAELDDLEKDLTFYEKLHDKIYGDEGVLKEVQDAADGAHHVTYTRLRTYPAGKEDEFREAADTPVAAIDTQESEVIPFITEKLAAGQVRVYELMSDDRSVSRGKFTEEHSMTAPKTHTGSFKVKEFPKEPAVQPPARALTDAQKTQFERDKVDFSLAMAVQVLASMDGKPTKDKPVFIRGSNDEMLKYLYGAMITLGVDHSAIKVRSKSFDPDNEKGRLWGFKAGSYTQTKYKIPEHSAMVKQAKEDLEKNTHLKTDKNGHRKELSSDVAKATRLFKEKNTELKKTVEDVLKEEGPKPAP